MNRMLENYINGNVGLAGDRTPDNVAWDGTRLDYAALNDFMKELAYILGIDPHERVNNFTLAQMPGQTFHCHNRCKQIVLNCKGDWTKLPSGPIRSAYEEAFELQNQNKPE